MKALIDQLERDRSLPDDLMVCLIKNHTEEDRNYLFEKARKISQSYYGNTVYIRGLIEFTNYCKNDCLYCGIRCHNNQASRYRLTKEDILECCQEGYRLGFRTFVLQGGEDPWYTKERLTEIVAAIRQNYPDCAITLSAGERPFEDYQSFYDAGANRYLLRHETADSSHYSKLHPEGMTLETRMECLWNLKKIGYQVGTGFMVGSPYQTTACLVEDLKFIRQLQPQMVGIGPFISHKDTPFGECPSGTLELTTFMLGILRLTLPYALLPSTTALGTIDPKGREKGILSGANVVMPNLSPLGVRKKYELYDNKICTGDEAAQCIQCLKRRVGTINYEIVTDRGDCKVPRA